MTIAKDHETFAVPAATSVPVHHVWDYVVAAGQTLLPAMAIALLVHLFLAQAMRVYGQSMEPTLHTDQRLIVEKISYHVHAPQRGDIVVVRVPDRDGEYLVKRVVALAGEVVQIKGGRVYVDGKLLNEPYLTQVTPGDRSWIVAPLHVFVMGDNRAASNDSRFFGAVAQEQIVGHALYSYWPPGAIGALP